MSQHQFVICIENADYGASLELRKLYETIPDPEAALVDRVRVIDESGEDYLYPASCFVRIELPRKVEAAVLGVS
jgi:hypothetical protein